MGEQSEITLEQNNSGMLAEYRKHHPISVQLLQKQGAQSYFLSQFSCHPKAWDSAHYASQLRKMQSRNWIAYFVNAFASLFKEIFYLLGHKSENLLSGLIPPQKARTISFLATALLMAVITLACCREINMYYFRSVARSENAAVGFKTTTSNHASAAKTGKLMLSQTHSII